MPQSAGQIQTELDAWYAARLRIAKSGSSATVSTSAGLRVVTHEDLATINDHISALEQQLSAANRPTAKSRYDFAVASFQNRE